STARYRNGLKPLCVAAALLLIGCRWTEPAVAAAPAPRSADCTIATRSQAVGSGTIAYHTAGHGPVLLLLHGLFAAKEQWNTLVCLFANAGYQALAVDLPGYGSSAGYALQDYRLDQQAALLREFTRRLGITRLDIAGSSMGGAIATLYARRHRQQVRTLAFIGAPLGIVGWGPGIRNAVYRGINPFIPINGYQFELELYLLFMNPPTIPPPEKQAIIADYVTRNRHYVQVWDIVNLYDEVLQQQPLPQLPALIVWGVEDRIYPIAGADALHRALPGSAVNRLPRAGHLLLMENAHEVAPIYLSFLRNARARTDSTDSLAQHPVR
ncbi:MAG: alpha/beta hydrolase, partial [Gammaproteobacteria bacterium]|nr:alpha/beta hydrolase [Gammaproteobacteria bacterium]